MWHGAEIIERKNSGHDSSFKNSGHDNIFEVEKDGRKNSEIQLQKNHADPNNANLNHTDSIHANSTNSDSTNIKPKSQYDLVDSQSLQNIMSWGSQD